jgi:tetratricopeptide (TPR) repeat protein
MVLQFTESDVRRLALDQSFLRGENYYASGAVTEVEQRGDRITARVWGTQADAYRVTIELGASSILSTRCSCPYDWGGICKHIVAVLLTLVRKPDFVEKRPPLDELLAQRSKQDLISLVKEMIVRQPDLARLLDLPLHPESPITLDLAKFEKQVHYALSREDAEWAGREIQSLNEMADRYLAAGDRATAGTLYHLILEKALVHFEGWWPEWDSEGDVSSALSACAEGLGECLEEVEDEETRQPWLDVLLEAELTDIRHGGIDYIWPAGDLVLEHATDEEWTRIEARLRREIESSGDWAHGTLVRFLTTRLQMAGQEREANAFILAHGTAKQKAFLLLELGRIDEAVEIARSQFANLPGLVLGFANRMVDAGHSEAAVAFMVEQVNEGRGFHYKPWLARHFEEHGDAQAALDMWRRQFEESPRFETYQDLRRLATQTGGWDQLRSTLLGNLDTPRYATLLIDIALDEGNIDRALEIASQPGALMRAETQMRVAQAAEADHPRAAIEIYRSRAERAIAARGRGNYVTAAELLLRVRDLYRRLGEESTWQGYITRLREAHTRLWALKEELDRAGL